jgi:hypothetical protein
MTSVIYRKKSVLGPSRYWDRRKKTWTKWLCKSCHYNTHKGALRVLNSRAFYENICFNLNIEYGVTNL